MPDAARKIFLAGYYGFGNAGDEAILGGLLADLRVLRPDVELLVASGDPASTAAAHGVRAVHRDDLSAVAAAIRDSDLVIVGGGGLFQDYWDVPEENLFTPRSGGLPFYAGFSILAELLGRPSMLYAIGVGPLRTELGRRLTVLAFELSAGATVRDAESLAVLKSLGVAAVEVTADPAFSLVPSSGERISALLAELDIAPGERPVGVALRPWPFGPDGWEAEVAEGLDRLLASGGDRLLFLPFQDEDAAVHRRICQAMTAGKRAVLAERPLDPAELAGLIGRCGSVLAMRYHAALFALAAGVPTGALAYDPKVSALLSSAGLADLALPPEAWRSDAVCDLLQRVRKPTAGFGSAMRSRAQSNASRAVEIMEQGVPAPSEARRFLNELAVDKLLAAYRLEGESSQPAALVTALRGEVAESERLRAEAEHQVMDARTTIEELEHERAGLREQRELILAERNDVDRRLSALERTLAYRIVSRFWRLMRLLFPEGSRRRKLYRLVRRVVASLLGTKDVGPAPAQAIPGVETPDPRVDLLRFEETVRAGGARQVAAIFSATQLVESEGQRPMQLALALARRGVPVVFVYWRWWDNEWRPQDRLAEGILQVPIDVVTRRPDMVAGAFAGLERIALFEFPHPGFFETLSAANSAGWITAYDVLDDWEEFQRVGQAEWFDAAFERHLIGACDAVFAVNDVLAERLRALGGAVEVVGNGLKPGIEIVRDPRPLQRGEITVGYFGYLAGAWFDWSLIAEAARLRPSWRFYLIGYGGSPEGVALPETVQLLGKQPQADLAAYAANWDVAVIPFKPDRLAAGADPIKTYEYLAMGLPVVTTGVHPPAGGEAFVSRAEGAEDFARQVERAARRPAEEERRARRAFAASCTWDSRLGTLLASIAEGRQRVAEKRALFEARP